MISTIILSKDRPAQLHLLLESIQKNSGNLFAITVVYDYSNQDIELGYDKLQNFFYLKNRRDINFPIRWWKRKFPNLSEDIIHASFDSNELICIFDDENILFNRISSYSLIRKMFENHDLSSLSLRLGNNTVIQNPYEKNSYFADIPQDGEFVEDRFLVWDATTIKPYTNFGMPFSARGHIYRKSVLYNVLVESEIEEIENFEEVLQKNLYDGKFDGNVPSKMSCPEYSVVISNSIKRIYDIESNVMGIDNNTINYRYLNDKKIDYNFFNFTKVFKPDIFANLLLQI